MIGRDINKILDDDSSEVFTCAVNLAEVINKVARAGRDVEGALAYFYAIRRS